MNPLLLTGLNGGQTNKQYVITERGLQLGRDPSNDICLDDPDVSRHHARVILYNSALWVQDTGSRNGVFVNNSRITNHKQLSPGDQLLVGSHAFRIDMGQPRGAAIPAVEVDMGVPDTRERSGFKKWPFIVAIAAVILIIGLIAAAGSGAEPAEVEGGGTEASAGGDAYSLEAALAGLEGDRATAPDAPASGSADGTSLEEALRSITDGEAQGMEGWPDPPEGVSSGELVDQGHALYRAGRLHDAMLKYQMGAKAAAREGKECKICAVRIDKVSKEIALAIQENYDAGFKYYESMQYQQAITAWETVLLLEPDEEAEIHVRTAEYLEQARAAVMRQY